MLRKYKLDNFKMSPQHISVDNMDPQVRGGGGIEIRGTKIWVGEGRGGAESHIALFQEPYLGMSIISVYDFIHTEQVQETG